MTIKRLLPIIFLALCLPSVAQRSTSDSVEYRSPYLDLRPVKCQRQYHIDPQRQLHGTYTVKGSDNIKWSRRTDSQQYTEVRHYNHGALEGSFSQHYSHTGVGDIAGSFQVDRRWSIKGQFVEGRPDGMWQFTVLSKMHSKSENSTTRYTLTAQYVQGELRSFSDDNGHRITVHPDGTLSGTATLKDGTEVTLSHSIVANKYLDWSGNRMTVGRPQQQALSQLSNPFSMADSGYAVDYQEIFLTQTSQLADQIDRYGHLPSLAPQFPRMPYSVRLGQLRQIHAASSDDAFEYYYQQSGQADQMLGEGFYIKRGSKRFIGNQAAQRIRAHHTQRQSESLGRKLDMMAKLSETQSWEQILEDCRQGRSPLLDMMSLRWSRTDLSTEEMYREAASAIDRIWGPLYPICGHTISHSEYHPHKGLQATVEMKQLAADSVSYHSFVIEIPTSPEGTILLSDMDPSRYQPISNEWDSIWAYEARLKNSHKQLMEAMAPLRLWRPEYKAYFDSTFYDRSTLPDVRKADLDEIDEIQRDLFANIETLRTIQRQHEILLRRAETSKRRSSDYTEWAKREFPNIHWTTAALNRFLERQRQMMEKH